MRGHEPPTTRSSSTPRLSSSRTRQMYRRPSRTRTNARPRPSRTKSATELRAAKQLLKDEPRTDNRDQHRPSRRRRKKNASSLYGGREEDDRADLHAHSDAEREHDAAKSHQQQPRSTRSSRKTRARGGREKQWPRTRPGMSFGPETEFEHLFRKADALGDRGWNFFDKYWYPHAADMKNFRLRTRKYLTPEQWNGDGYESFLHEYELKDEKYAGITAVYRELRLADCFDIPEWMKY